jgi:hypothetical protein
MPRKLSTAAVALGTLAAAAAHTPAAFAERYVVLYKSGASTSKAADWIGRSGGTVVIASSGSPTFAQAMNGGAGIDTVAVSRAVVKVDVPEASPGDLPNAPATEDSLAARPVRHEADPRARGARNHGGSPAVVVGDIDTGLDKDHPDLVGNIDFARSVSCESGAPVSAPAAWDDHAGHARTRNVARTAGRSGSSSRRGRARSRAADR